MIPRRRLESSRFIALGIVLLEGLDAFGCLGLCGDLPARAEVFCPFPNGHLTDEGSCLAGCSDELIGEDVDRGEQLRVEARQLLHPLGILHEHRHLLPPLTLDGGRGGEDDRRGRKAADGSSPTIVLPGPGGATM